jgi:hypothetical protein
MRYSWIAREAASSPSTPASVGHPHENDFERHESKVLMNDPLKLWFSVGPASVPLAIAKTVTMMHERYVIAIAIATKGQSV